MTGDDGEFLRQVAVGDRDAGERRHGQRRGDAGDDGAGHARLRAGLGFLTAPAEDVGVAALEPHDPGAGPGPVDEDRVDLLLGPGAGGRTLAYMDDLRVGRRGVEQDGRGEPVDHDHVGGREQLTTTHSQQPGIARTSPDQPDLTRDSPVHHGVHRTCSSLSDERSRGRRHSAAESAAGSAAGQWMPHSVLFVPAQRPARPAPRRVHGQQPTES